MVDVVDDETLRRSVGRVEDVVQASRERVDVLAVKGGDEGAVQLGQGLVGDAVALVFHLLQLLDLGLKVRQVVEDLAEERNPPDDVGGCTVKEIQEVDLLGQEPAHATPVLCRRGTSGL